MRYRITRNTEDMHRIVSLELVVWGLREVDAVPVNILTLCAHNGGVLIVSEDKTVLTGFSVSLPARRHGEWILWSHITGVHPQYQGQGIGRTLKLKQREWAKANGYDKIGWTFDPLQSANANFNLNVLRARAHYYHPNHYGVMRDGINSSELPSDRLEVQWNLLEPMKKPDGANTVVKPQFLVDEYGEFLSPDVFPESEEHLAICIPKNGGRESSIRHWQTNMRKAFTLAFTNGYIATQFVRRNQGTPYYLLTR